MTKSEIITVPYNFTPRDYQLELLQAMDSGIKRAFLRWPRRAGKDKVCLVYLAKEAAKIPGNYFYMFPEATQGRRALWENIDKDGFPTLGHIPDILIKRRANQEMLLELTNGSTIRVIGTDSNPNSLRGVAARGAVFSEFAYQDTEFYKALMPSLRESGGWAIFNSTPTGRNHFYHLEKAVRNSDNWFFSTKQVLWPDRPNYIPILTPDQLSQVQHEERLEDEDMEREYGVCYSTGMKGAFYADQLEKAKEEGRIGAFPPDDHNWVDTFWDLGVDDSTAVWFRQVDGGRVTFIDYYENSGQPISHYVEVLKDKGYKYRTHYLPHDGAHRSLQTGLTTRELLSEVCHKAGISDDVATCPKVSVQDGINAVRSRFSRYFFNEGMLGDAVEKLALYHRRWDKKREVFLKEPVHDGTSHCADALRMEALAEDFLEDEFYKLNKIQVNTDFDVL